MNDIRDIIEFRSARFAPVLSDDYQVNPGVYGAELAFWLCAELARAGIATSYPEAEDWGWYVQYSGESGSEFAVHCSNVDALKDHWHLSLRRFARKSFGRDRPPYSDAAGLVAAIQTIVNALDDVGDIEWLYANEPPA